MSKNEKTSIVLFQQKNIRRIWHNERWYFSVIDIIEVLAGTERPRKYWNDLKKKLQKEGFNEVSEKIGQLKMQARDGKMYSTDVADTETLLRIIQTIPSPNAEPFKRWLAKVGYERLEEIENPELAMERMKKFYEQKGYSKEWIEKRSRGIAIRNDLTDEWKNRGANSNIDYAILTNEITKAAFDMNVQEYKQHKGLSRQNLRDSMNDMELILTMLGEATATTLHRDRDSQGMNELKNDSKEAGEVAGNARRDIEKRRGKKVVSKENYLDLTHKAKKNLKLPPNGGLPV